MEFDPGLGIQYRNFEETLSVFTVLIEHFIIRGEQ